MHFLLKCSILFVQMSFNSKGSSKSFGKVDFLNLKNFLYICFIFVLGVFCYLGYLVKESLEYRHIDLGSISVEVDTSKFVSSMTAPSFKEDWTDALKLGNLSSSKLGKTNKTGKDGKAGKTEAIVR